MATSTPWGPSQQTTKLRPGITRYDTASHGGYHVSKKLNAGMPYALRRGDGWYEEDCDWSRVALAFPESFTTDERTAAEATLRNWFPASYESFYGRALMPGESTTRDLETFVKKNENNFVVRAAWGDWHALVPAGQVGVLARRASDKAEAYFLVTDAEYTGNFVVDPVKHGAWTGPDAK